MKPFSQLACRDVAIFTSLIIDELTLKSGHEPHTVGIYRLSCSLFAQIPRKKKRVSRIGFDDGGRNLWLCERHAGQYAELRQPNATLGMGRRMRPGATMTPPDPMLANSGNNSGSA